MTYWRLVKHLFCDEDLYLTITVWISDLKTHKPSLYTRIVDMLGRGPKDWRFFQVHTSISSLAVQDSFAFLDAWNTSGEDTVDKLMQIAVSLNRFDIVNEIQEMTLPPSLGDLEPR